MKIKNVILLAALVAQTMGCDSTSSDFEMTVDKVDELKGFILKGISISGEVQSGCIANDDAFVVKREGKQDLEEIARIVNVKGLKSAEEFGGEVYKGDYVTLYIPDGKKQDVSTGDLVVSNTISCQKTSP